MRLALASLPLALVALLPACSQGDDAVASADSRQTESTDVLYPTEIRPGMSRSGTFDPQNATVGDFGTRVRDQGSIASCASFGFLGLLENQMFNDHGVSPDLSERFMIFSNFFQTGTMGGDRDVIAQFPTLVDNLGLLTEDAYPYAAVNANGNRFEQDAAQGLQTDHSQPSLSSVLEGTANGSSQRSEILQRAEFIGKLPAGPYPVMLPVKARLQPNAKVPQIEFKGKFFDCFAEGGPAAAPEAKRLAVTPRELLRMCFDLDPKSYFACSFDPAKAESDATRAAKSTDECGRAREISDGVAAGWIDVNRKSLALALALLDRGEAVSIGVTAPAAPRNVQPIWSSKTLELGGGHAVLAIGYLTTEELASTTEQSRGLLASGQFDKLAAMVDPDFAARLAAGLPSDAAARRDMRMASKLGERMKTEGGILLFRNSWGTSTQGLPIGVDGNQAMTFDYFLKTMMIVQGRSQARVQGVAWQAGAGPSYCPATVDVPQSSAWLRSADRVADHKAYVRTLAVPATCGP